MGKSPCSVTRHPGLLHGVSPGLCRSKRHGTTRKLLAPSLIWHWSNSIRRRRNGADDDNTIHNDDENNSTTENKYGHLIAYNDDENTYGSQSLGRRCLHALSGDSGTQ